MIMTETRGENKSLLFLATTALDDFWDTSKPILFLGEWCLRYSRRHFWEKLNSTTMPPLWNDPEKIRAAYDYVNDVYERFLLVMGQALNDIHHRKQSDRSWRIIIGPWLFHYIHVLYDRYLSLRAALDCYPQLETIGLSEKCFVYPNDTEEFVAYLSSDAYNLQMFTRILTFLGKETEKKTWNHGGKNQQKQGRGIAFTSLLQRLVCYICRYHRVFSTRHPYILLSATYFSFMTILKLFFKTKGRLRFEYGEKRETGTCNRNPVIRSALRGLSFGKNEFERVLAALTLEDLPWVFLEGYNEIEKDSIQKYPKRAPVAILSAISWYSNETFKQWAAKCVESGTVLMGMQHGGNYGNSSYMQHEDHELAFTDRYYSWGWKRNRSRSEIIPMPAAKFIDKKSIGASNKRRGILFVGTCVPRYLYRFHLLNHCEYAEYLKTHLQFVSCLSSENRAKTRVRLYRRDHGWDVSHRWKDLYPDIELEGWDTTFYQSLKNCRLYVCDHLSTTFAEALALNQPTVLFWDPRIFALRSEAKPFFDALRDVGVLHNTPESAARLINSVYDDVESWWYNSERQLVLKKFRHQYARISKTAVDEWARELNDYSASS